MMCSGSPALRRAGARTVVAGASTQELLEGVDACTVAIAPVHPKTVGPNQGQAQWFYIGSHVCRIEQWAPADLLHATGARTGQPKQPCRIKSLVATVIPLDKDAIVAAVNGVGNGEHGWELGVRSRELGAGSWEVGGGSGKAEDPPAFEGSSLAPSSQLRQATKSRSRSPVSPSRRRSKARSRSCLIRSRVTPIIRPISSRVRLLPSSRPKYSRSTLASRGGNAARAASMSRVWLFAMVLMSVLSCSPLANLSIRSLPSPSLVGWSNRTASEFSALNERTASTVRPVARASSSVVGMRPNRSFRSVVVRPSRLRSAVRFKGPRTGLP